MVLKSFTVFLFLNISLSNNNLDSLLIGLENEINKKEFYDIQKEERIKFLVEKSKKKGSLKERYKINNEIYKEYLYYNFDNAIKYIENNIQLAYELKNDTFINESKLKLGLLLVNTGRYKESIDILNEIVRTTLAESLLDNYYVAYNE